MELTFFHLCFFSFITYLSSLWSVPHMTTHKSFHAVSMFWLDSTHRIIIIIGFSGFGSLSARWCDVVFFLYPGEKTQWLKVIIMKFCCYFIAWKESRFNTALSIIRRMPTSIRMILTHHSNCAFKGVDSVTSLTSTAQTAREEEG